MAEQLKLSSTALEISNASISPYVYKKAVCSTDYSLDINSESNRTATNCGSLIGAGSITASGTINAIIPVSTSANELSYQDFLTILNSQSLVHIRFFGLDSDEEDVFYLEMDARITAVGASASYEDGYLTFSVTFENNGNVITARPVAPLGT